MRCAVGRCKESNSKKSTTGKHVSFYSFPKDEARKKLWVKFCNRVNSIKTQNEKVCSLHFKEEDFERNLKFEMGFSSIRKRNLNPEAIPTIDPTITANKKNAHLNNDSEVKPLDVYEIVVWEEKNTPLATDINENSNQLAVAIKEDSLELNIKPFVIKKPFVCNENSSMSIDCNENDILLHIKTEETNLITDINVDSAQNRPQIETTDINEDSLHIDINTKNKLLPSYINNDSPQLHIKTEELDVEPTNICEDSTKNTYLQTEEPTQIISTDNYVNGLQRHIKPLQVEINETLENKEGNALKSIAVNTDSLLMQIKNLEKKIVTLRQENNMIRSQFAIKSSKLSSQVKHLSITNGNFEKALRQLFTENQIKKIKFADKRQKYTPTDIAHSIILYRKSPQAYRLLNNNKFPLPSVRTLQRWSQKSKLNKSDDTTVILEPVGKILSAANKMTEEQKLCALYLTEPHAKSIECYNKPKSNNLQVALLRGLNSKWKQTIYYNYDCQVKKTILFNILKTIKQSGLKIVAIVCDLGGWNSKLFEELEVDCKKPWFLYEETKIFVFNDVPHLIKLLRNHFIDSGFIINDKHIKKDIILNLLSLSSNKIKINRKLLEQNLDVGAELRHKVKLAIKLFSHNVAHSITQAANLGLLSNHNWCECNNLLELINDWLDVMSSKLPRQNATEGCHAYGFDLETQNDILNNMSEMMSEMRVIGKNFLLSFQKGIIQTNNALMMLLIELKAQHNIDHVFAYRLNQEL